MNGQFNTTEDFLKELELGEENKPYEIVSPAAMVPKRLPFWQRLKAQPVKTITESAAGVGKFLGMEPFGKGLALTSARFPGIRRIAAPEIADIEAKMKRGETLTPGEATQYASFFGEAPTTKQVLGSAALTAANIVAAGRLAPSGVPSFQLARGIPMARYALPFTMGTTLKQSALSLARTGTMATVVGVASAAEQNLPTKSMLKRGLQTAAFSMGFESLLGGASRALQETGKGLAQNLASYAAKPEKAEKYILQKKMLGTVNRMLKIVGADTDAYEEQLQNAFIKGRGLEERITIREILRKATESKRESFGTLQRFFDEKTAMDEFNKSLDLIDPALKLTPAKKPNYVELNEIRRAIDKKLKDRDFLILLDTLPEKRQNLMALRWTIQDVIGDKIPEVKPIFSQYSAAIEANQALDKIQKVLRRRRGPTFMEILETLGAGGGMYYATRRPEAAVGIGLTALALQHPASRINLSSIMLRAGEFLGRPLSLMERLQIQRILSKSVIPEVFGQ